MKKDGKRFSGKRKFFILFPSLFLLLAGSGLFFRYGMSYFVRDPIKVLEEEPSCVSFRDREGKLLYLERSREGKWRFDIPLSQVPPHFVKALLATEDFHFFRHNGVDWQALARAFLQNLFYRRKISGASTITMQLAGMSLPGRHTLFWKCRQMWGAWKLERLYSKERILTEYVNRLPFGGRYYGIECGARYYFGVPAIELTPPQSALLCGLPQRPNFFRPDRHRARAVKRMRLVLGMMYERGIIREEEARKWQKERNLNFRDFQVPADFERYGSPGDFLHGIRAFRKDHKKGRGFTLSLHKELTARSLMILRSHLKRLPSVSSSACLLVENSTGRILIYIGSSDLSNPDGGSIDMIQKKREAGSTLKPFLYGEALEGGLLTGATLLQDAPLRYKEYAPGNFDDLLHGELPASLALAKSLNTPLIRLAAFLGVKRVETLLVRAGLSSFTPEKGRDPGLTIALGCGGCTLRELVRSYRMLANKGVLLPLTLEAALPEKSPSGRRVFSPGSCAMLSLMLRKIPLGPDAPDCAWKTGTSSNCRDAWAILYTPSHTLGVWFGNPSGKSSPFLVGAESALPAAKEIMGIVREMESSFSDSWESLEPLLEERWLCKASGLTPTARCREKIREKAIPGIPLPYCGKCGKKSLSPPRILSPLPGEYFLREGQKKLDLPFRLSGGEGKKLLLFINGEPVPSPAGGFISFPKEGRYTIRPCILLPGKKGENHSILTGEDVTLTIRRWQEE